MLEVWQARIWLAATKGSRLQNSPNNSALF